MLLAHPMDLVHPKVGRSTEADRNDQTVFLLCLAFVGGLTYLHTNDRCLKILRFTNKFIKYSGSKQTEVELKIYFCSKIKASRIRIDDSVMLSNLYNREIEKIKTAIAPT